MWSRELLDGGNEITNGDGNRGRREEETGKGCVEGEEERLEEPETLLRGGEKGGGEDGISMSCIAEAGEVRLYLPVELSSSGSLLSWSRTVKMKACCRLPEMRLTFARSDSPVMTIKMKNYGKIERFIKEMTRVVKRYYC